MTPREVSDGYRDGRDAGAVGDPVPFGIAADVGHDFCSLGICGHPGHWDDALTRADADDPEGTRGRDEVVTWARPMHVHARGIE